ncbi:MAG: 3-hydroxyadipyl-CoA dehydrogenase [Alphaproteobacteria bacterium MarineAlpha11_Bin1]|nr:MAG: 3-hydroxyadipyl-CoA dehydrogenase [Alphaproteobacteria bacterium MarineAlpha11_Bin1]|tara:strand:- start:926 stop:2452 length:1527 start_codon:yes stop_codon:yes gene_type:complete
MAQDVNSPDYIIGIIGTGTMGRGIAQISVAGGYKVKMYDAQEGAAREAEEFIHRMISRSAEKGQISEGEAAAANGRLNIVNSLSDFGDCSLVIEAIVEKLNVKREVFSELEGIVAGDAILASNTSSLSVTQIAAGCKNPERVAGYHYFNPVPLLKVVEVVEGQMTAPWVVEKLEIIARKCGHEPVRTHDTPGFLVNHAGRGLYTEGVRILAEGIADPHQVDDVLREGGASFRMGPFELMDTTGLDVSGVVMESIYEQFYQEQRFKPQAFIRNRMAAGLHGRKVGRGFYKYEDNRKVMPEEAAAPTGLPDCVWVGPEGHDGANTLVEFLKKHVDVETGGKPSAKAICMVAPLGSDATMTAIELGVEAERTVAVDTLFGLEGRLTLMTTSVTDDGVRDLAHGALAADGAKVTVIHDSPGFIAQRVIATIVNISSEIAQMRIATPEDINKAVKLGLAYPQGPLEFGDTLGPQRIHAILSAMWNFYGDPRYRPSPWLTRRARLGISLMTPEA